MAVPLPAVTAVELTVEGWAVKARMQAEVVPPHPPPRHRLAQDRGWMYDLALWLWVWRWRLQSYCSDNDNDNYQGTDPGYVGSLLWCTLICQRSWSQMEMP